MFSLLLQEDNHTVVSMLNKNFIKFTKGVKILLTCDQMCDSVTGCKQIPPHRDIDYYFKIC
jgi:hypothetical protein